MSQRVKHSILSYADLECTWCTYLSFPLIEKGEKTEVRCRRGHFKYSSTAKITDEEYFELYKEFCDDFCPCGGV